MGFDLGNFVQSVGNGIAKVAQTAVQIATAAGLGLFTAGPGGALIGVTMAVVDDLVGTKLLNSAVDVANLLGIVNVQLVYHFLTDLSKGVVNMPQLGNDLAADWATIKRDEGEAVALTNGDYRKCWDLYTDSGALFAALPPALKAALPQPSPDKTFNIAPLTAKVNAGTIDLQDAAVQAAEHGYYNQAQAWRTQWRAGLVNSPLGGVLAAGNAKASGEPLTMLRVAKELQGAMADKAVIANWTAHKWGAPSATFSGLVTDLQSTAKAKLAPPAAKAPTMTTPVRFIMPMAAAQQIAAANPTGAFATALDQSGAQLVGVKAPLPTPANPTAGRTILGLPALDVGLGVVGLVAVGIVAKVRHWF